MFASTGNTTLFDTLGRIATLMTRSNKYCHYPIACLSLWIKPAILLRQLHIFQDAGGNDVGYMTWARIAADTEERLLNDPAVLLHVSEWNEGDRLWITDFLVVNGRSREMVKQAALLLRNDETARSLRRNDDGTVRCFRTWNLPRERQRLHAQWA